MPDISKINALAIGSVAKVDGIAKASILNINGVAVPAAVAPPLDTYTGASAAYSVRLLRTLYSGPAMRVRRETAGGAGDDDEADIAFDSGVISLDSAISNASAGVTATTLGQFLNVGTVNGTTYTNPDSLTVTASCFVDEWKDQSGNANHAEQTAKGNQPQIHSGTVNTDLITENGKPAIDFISNSSRSLNGPTLDNNSIMAFTVNREVTNRGTIWGLGGGIMYKILEVNNWSSAQLLIFTGDGTNYQNSQGTATKDLSQHLITVSRFSNALKAYVDGSLDINTTDTYSSYSAALGFGVRNTQGQLLLQEAIFYSTDQSINRTGIESNVNTYFSIY